MEKTFQKTAIGIVLLLMAYIVFAFSRTYFGLLPDVTHLDLVIHVHVISVTAWMLMLVIQPCLIFTRNRELHQRVGTFSYFLFPFMIVTCVLVMAHMQVREKEVFIFTANIFMLLTLCTYYGLAIYYKKRKPQWHGRFMIMTLIPFIAPASARIKFNGDYISIAILAALFTVEFFRGKVFKPYLIAIGVYFLYFIPLLSLLMLRPAALEWLWNLFFD